MNTIYKIILACIVTLASAPLLAETNNNSGKHIVKWVDSQGVTHYGDKLPAQEAGRNNTVLNNQGITVKKVDVSAIAKNADLEKKSIELSRKDNAIIASYSTLEEIDLARDRNLKLEEFELLSLFQRQINNKKNLQQRNVLSAGFIQRNKEVPPKIIQEIVDLQTNINKTPAETMRTMSNTISGGDKNNQNSNNSHIVEEVIHLLPSAEMLRQITNTLMDCLRKGMTSILLQKNKKQNKNVGELVGGVEREGSEVDTNTNDPLVDEEEEEEVVNDYEDILMMDKTSTRGNLLLLTLLQEQIMSCPLPLSSSQRPWLPVRLDQHVYLKTRLLYDLKIIATLL